MKMNRALKRLSCAALAVALTGSAGAETVFTKSISYYKIGGRTAEELDRELSRRGPYTNSTGMRHPGATEIKFGGEVTYLEKNGRCQVKDVKVTLATHITLPRWKNRSSTDGDLALVWDALSSDIKRHEERHAEIARQHAQKLEKSLKSLRPRPDCDSMQDKVAEVSQKAVEAHDKDQMRFDRVESINFEQRLIRIMHYRLEQMDRKKP